MKRIGMLGAALMAAGALWAADPSISLSRVQQRYPWNGMVDIDYTVANVPAGSEASYYVRFKITENGNTHTLHEFLDTSTLYDASNGTYRVTWNSAWEDAEYRFFAKSASVQAELVSCGDDKSEQPYGDRYVIIDLSSGTNESQNVASTYPVTTTNFYTLAEATNEFNNAEKTFYKTTHLVLRRVRSGTFTMGSPTNEWGRMNTQKPPKNQTIMNYETQHQVTLTQNFLLGMYPVTQTQYELVMGTNPSTNKGQNVASCPVEMVVYSSIRGKKKGSTMPPTYGNFDNNSFMETISRRTGLTFDLPTEAQWEYACRAGTTTACYAGSFSGLTNDVSDTVGWYMGNCDTTMPVGLKIPNAWGFYDMLGNVWEISRDVIRTMSEGAGGSDLGAEPVTDPLTGYNERKDWQRYCLRGGGGFMSNADSLRAAARNSSNPWTKASPVFGFRLSRILP